MSGETVVATVVDPLTVVPGEFIFGVIEELSGNLEGK